MELKVSELRTSLVEHGARILEKPNQNCHMFDVGYPVAFEVGERAPDCDLTPVEFLMADPAIGTLRQEDEAREMTCQG